LRARRRRNVLFVGEVQLGLDQDQYVYQRASPKLGSLLEMTGGALDRKTSLLFRFSLDEIPESLDRNEIKLPVFEGAARKFSGARKAKSRRSAQRLEEVRYDGWGSMHLKLGAVFPSEAVRPRKPENQTAIYDVC
jgi:hypothetical protein